MNNVPGLVGIVYNPFTDCISFCGYDVHTGLPISILFNEPHQHNTRLLMWNPLLKKYMHSIDAGLTWTPHSRIDDDFIWSSVDLIIGKLPLTIEVTVTGLDNFTKALNKANEDIKRLKI